MDNMKILVIGKGGREHALGDKLAKSKRVKKIYFAPGNAGMENLGERVDISENDVEKLVEFAKSKNIDLTVVGPESSLSLGVVDRFVENGLKIFGPTKNAVRVESSKEFAKSIMQKYNIPTGAYAAFDNYEDVINYIKDKPYPIVIKEDGLRSGKGVSIVNTFEDAKSVLKRVFGIENRVLIEEFLTGREFSIITMVNGENIIPLQIAQDHKRAYDEDRGENTGGMGVYSPVDWVTEDIVKETMEKIMQPMAAAMVKEGNPFCGFLFGGIMVTDAGVKTIEFNGRFGDPEAQGILPRMEDDLVEIILDLLDGKTRKISWKDEYMLGVVMASKGYPGKYEVGYEIKNLDNVNDIVYHMGTENKDKKIVTNGGRVLTVMGRGKTLVEAKENAYANVKKIECENLFYRKDIGAK